MPYLDVAAVANADGKTLTLFMVNRHPDEAMTIDAALTGFRPRSIAEHVVLAHADLGATNIEAAPNNVVPKKGRGLSLRDGRVKGRLPSASYTVLRITI